MNRKSNTPENQEVNVGRQGKRSPGPKTGKKNELKRLTKEEQRELEIRAEEIGKGLTSSTWKELETDGKFDKNRKLDFIKDDTLIVGCDVGSETHYIRAIDIMEKLKLYFGNNPPGFGKVAGMKLIHRLEELETDDDMFPQY